MKIVSFQVDPVGFPANEIDIFIDLPVFMDVFHFGDLLAVEGEVTCLGFTADGVFAADRWHDVTGPFRGEMIIFKSFIPVTIPPEIIDRAVYAADHRIALKIDVTVKAGIEAVCFEIFVGVKKG